MLFSRDELVFVGVCAAHLGEGGPGVAAGGDVLAGVLGGVLAMGAVVVGMGEAGTSQILQASRGCEAGTSNWVPHVAQMRRSSLPTMLEFAGGVCCCC